MKKIKALVLSTLLLAGIGNALLVAQPALAGQSNGNDARQGINAARPDGVGGSLTGAITIVVNILLFIIGVISVIMIIIGGIRYTLSNGDSGQITSAKNTILYAVVGLVVALLAYAIVNFVLDQF